MNIKLSEMGLKKQSSEERRLRLEGLLKENPEQYANLRKVLDQPVPDKVRPGQLWTTNKEYWSPSGKGKSDHSFVLLVLKGTEESASPSHPDVEAAVLYFIPEYATDKDLLLPDEMPIVGGNMVCLWNTGPFLIENLDRYIGLLDEELLKKCEHVWQYAAGIRNDRMDLMPVGNPILSTADIRIQFQEEFLSETTFLWEPAFEVAEELERKSTLAESAVEVVLKIRKDILDMFEILFKPSPSVPPVPLFAGTADPMSELRSVERNDESNADHVVDLVETEAFDLWLTRLRADSLFVRFQLKLPSPPGTISIVFAKLDGDELLSLKNIHLVEGEFASRIELSHNLLREPFLAIVSFGDLNHVYKIRFEHT